MLHGPKYSLLLPVRNEARRVRSVVEAIYADLGGGPEASGWEVVFGDDASDDGTREKLRELSAAYPFRLLQPEANLGRGAMRNLLAREARGEVLVFLDGDCMPLPGYFRAWEGLDQGAAYIGKVSYERVPAAGFSRFLEEGSGVGKLRRREAVPAAYFISQNFRISKSRFLEAGGFRTDLLGWGGEDTDLGYKLEARSTPLRYRGEAEARHPSVTDLEGYLERLRRFGRVNLPVLIRDHPGISRQFKLHLANLPWSLVFLNPLAYRICLALVAGRKAWPWPHALYRYAIFNSYAGGFREARKAALRGPLAGDPASARR